jgi:hypothetical protein
MSQTDEETSASETLEGPQLLPCVEDTPLDDEEVLDLAVIARIALWGVGAVQALLIQTKDGAESGNAHGSVRSRHVIKQSVSQRWVMVQQPLGYVTRISGFHSQLGTDCLLHSVRFEFASGQVIELQGEEFAVDLADNFYVSSLEFEGGVCVGYKGYSTPKPLNELMADESEPDIDILEQASVSEEDSDSPYIRSAQDPADRGKPDDDPRGPEQVPSQWVGEPLKAKYRPYDDNREPSMLAYVCLLGRDALQGAIFIFYDGHREGYLSAVRKRGICCKGKTLETDIHCDVEQFDLRGATFVPVEQPGGRITVISGRGLTPMPTTTTTPGPKVTYLCHTLNLEFASGQIIKFVGSYNDWKGPYFSYSMPGDFYANQLEFAPARIGSRGPGGFLAGVSGVRTYEDAADLESPEIKNKNLPCWDQCCCCLP